MRNGGSLADPVPLGTSTLRIEINGFQKHRLLEHGLDPTLADNRIIGAALGQSERAPTTIVSNDAALRIKAAHLGVAAAEHRRATSRRAARRSVGWITVETTFDVIDCLYAGGVLDVDAVDGAAPSPRRTSSPCSAPGRSRR